MHSDKDIAQRIGAAARLARKRLRLTQEEVAERLDVTTEFYARMERGGALPSVPTLIRMAAGLETSLDVLAGDAVAAASSPRGKSRRADVERLALRLDAASPRAVRALLAIADEIVSPTSRAARGK